MNKSKLNKLIETFGQVELHKYIGNVILEHSTNANHISNYVYKDINFSNRIKVLDIGCGYGRCGNYLKNVIPKGSDYIGIDPLINNKEPFQDKTSEAGFNSIFVCGDASRISDFPKNYFDLILCNYSLYFFIDKLPLIVKHLKSSGLFITITHSDKSLQELLLDLQKVLKLDFEPNWNDLGSEQILNNFNAENGYRSLNPFFAEIEEIKYKNNLEFDNNSIDELFDLLAFKKETLIHHNDYVEFIKTNEFDKLLRIEISNKIRENGKYTLNKDDVIFHCRKPINS